jgi:hypothetical protein
MLEWIWAIWRSSLLNPFECSDGIAAYGSGYDILESEVFYRSVNHVANGNGIS